MKTYSIPDLLIGQTYYPRSMARKYQYGEITFAEKREDIYLRETRKALEAEEKPLRNVPPLHAVPAPAA